MKKISLLGIILFLVTIGLVTGEGIKWFDTQNCAFCSQLAKYPGLFENMKTEFHNISNGIVTVVHVDSAFKQAYEKAQADMRKVAEDAQTTAKIPSMCGHCAGWAAFMIVGVKQELVRTQFADIVIMTSDDSVMVQKLHDFGNQAAMELVKIKSKK